MLTVAPTRTNKNTSAPTHNFPYLIDSLLATTYLFLFKPTHINMIAIRLEKVIEVLNESSSTTNNNEMLRIINTLDVSLICIFLKKDFK